MANEIKYYPSFDDLVFERRNKEYGAYDIRKKYSRTVTLSLITGVLVFVAAIVIPFINTKHRILQKGIAARVVIAEITNDIQSPDAPPPPPVPPPPPQEIQSVVKYVAPVVVDTIPPDERTSMVITDEQVETSLIKEAVGVKEEVQEDDEKEVPAIVEEMPEFPGGESALCRYIISAIRYPVIAQKSRIQGKVYVTFIVDKDGGVIDVRISQGIDPLLDREALRVVKNLPRWRPGKQRGKPVRVSYTVPIYFILP